MQRETRLHHYEIACLLAFDRSSLWSCVFVIQDKATLDMDIMDDGFLAKILKPEGSKDVLVGDPIAVVVAEASDVGAFKGFTLDSVGGGGGAAAAAPSPSPSPPPTPSPSSSPPPKRVDSSKVRNVR